MKLRGILLSHVVISVETNMETNYLKKKYFIEITNKCLNFIK